MAQVQTLVKDLPELFKVALRTQGNVHQIDGDHALIETAVVLVLAGLVVLGVGNVADTRIGEAVRRQEGAAAHAGIDVALQLPHLLLGDVVRHHALGGAAGGQLREIPVGRILVDIVLLKHVDQFRERRRDPDALLVFHALIALAQRLLDDHGKVMALLLVFRLSEIHEHRHERGLAVRGQQRDDLILDRLHAAADLLAHAVFDELGQLFLTRMRVDGLHFGLDLAADALAADLHERRQMRQRDRLPAVLVGGDLRDDLGRNVARGRETVRPLDERAGDDGAVFEHVLQIHKVAVVHMLRVIVGVVEVDDALLVRLDDVLRQQETARDVAADLAGHVVALRAVDDRILVGVFLLGLLVVALDEAQDAVVGRVGAAHQAAGVAVSNVGLGDLERTVGHDLLFDHVLNFLHGGAAAQLLAGELHALGDALDLPRRHAVALFDGGVGLRDGHDDLGDIERRLGAVALNDLHFSLSPPLNEKHNILWKKTASSCIKSGYIVQHLVPYVNSHFSFACAKHTPPAPLQAAKKHRPQAARRCPGRRKLRPGHGQSVRQFRSRWGFASANASCRGTCPRANTRRASRGCAHSCPGRHTRSAGRPRGAARSGTAHARGWPSRRRAPSRARCSPCRCRG